jgi:hypothetical protein
MESALHELRRDLVWRGLDLSRSGDFHAAEDRQVVRNGVFQVISKHDFRIDATILEKAKALPHLRMTDERFYQTAWFYHMKRLIQRLVTREDELFVVAASLGTGAKRNRFFGALNQSMAQCAPANEYRTICWPAASDPCLQIADYCCWALKRKWEDADNRSYSLIEEKLRSEIDLFSRGTKTYY